MNFSHGNAYFGLLLQAFVYQPLILLYAAVGIKAVWLATTTKTQVWPKWTGPKAILGLLTACLVIFAAGIVTHLIGKGVFFFVLALAVSIAVAWGVGRLVRRAPEKIRRVIPATYF